MSFKHPHIDHPGCPSTSRYGIVTTELTMEQLVTDLINEQKGKSSTVRFIDCIESINNNIQEIMKKKEERKEKDSSDEVIGGLKDGWILSSVTFYRKIRNVYCYFMIHCRCISVVVPDPLDLL
jgi:hypothetical protein